MRFLLFYILTTVICIITTLVVSKALSNRLKREFPAIVSKIEIKSSFSEKISSFLCLCVPVINIVFILIFIFCQEQLYKKLLEKLKDKVVKKVGEKPDTFDWTLEELEAYLEKEEEK
jgi:hypothetical protein|nr:MAG TPA: hypothetical protein [Caudoviricetes sp.]